MPGTIRPPSLDDEIDSPSAPQASTGARPPAPSGPRSAPINAAVAHAVTNYAPGRGSLVSHPGPLAKVCPECGLHYPAEFKVCPRDAVELNEIENDPKQDELVGQTLGATYTILRVIG